MPYEGLDQRMDRLETVLTTFIQHTDADIADMRQWRFEAQKRWGEIAQKMGTFVEDVVIPNIPRIARESFGLGGAEEELYSAPRMRLRHPEDSARMREFDYIYAAKRGWIVVESKNDPKLKDVDEFRQILADIREYFPQYARTPLYPIFAGLNVPDHVVKFCSRHRIYALGLGAETMQLLNLSEFPGPPGNLAE